MKLLIFLFVCFCTFVNSQLQPSGCIDLTTTQTLTFYKDAMTTSARAPPIKQLNCVGGNGCKNSNKINTIQCTNSGANDVGETQWVCKGQIPSNLELGTTTVSCEGCKSSSDFYKIAGSCGLFYTLNVISNSNDDTHNIRKNNGSNSNGWIFTMVIVGMVITIICCFAVAITFCARTNFPSNTSRLVLTPRTHMNTRRYSSYKNNNGYVPIATAPPLVVPIVAQPITPSYQTQPITPSYQNYNNYGTENNYTTGFAQGILMEDIVSNNGRHNNRVAEDLLLMNAIGGSNKNTNGFMNGVIVGSALNGHHNDNHHSHHNHHHNGHHHGHKKHHNNDSHESTGFGGSMTR